jgi:Protein of unknown function (DUF4238)
MRVGMKTRDMLRDLKIRFVENRTSRDFIIADDPAVMLNRFAFEKLSGSAFGAISSGLIFVMPLSPRFSVICYDGLMYSLDVINGRVVLKSEAAVDAYNDIQFIAAEENIYFQQWENGENVRQRFAAVKHKRRPASTVRMFVPDGETEDAEHYRPGTVDEARAAKRSLEAVRFNYPEPDRWIPGLRYRTNPKTFFNGTSVGHVRKREWLYRGRDEATVRMDRNPLRTGSTSGVVVVSGYRQRGIDHVEAKTETIVVPSVDLGLCRGDQGPQFQGLGRDHLGGASRVGMRQIQQCRRKRVTHLIISIPVGSATFRGAPKSLILLKWRFWRRRSRFSDSVDFFGADGSRSKSPRRTSPLTPL